MHARMTIIAMQAAAAALPSTDFLLPFRVYHRGRRSPDLAAATPIPLLRPQHASIRFSSPCPPRALSVSSKEFQIVTGRDKPPICTADELHYVPVPGTNWRLALWRYKPCPEAPRRNHPLVLLSGVGTNAIGFDLSPGASLARHVSSQGFDTWIVEVRGAGLSTQSDFKIAEQYVKNSDSEEPMLFISKAPGNNTLSGLGAPIAKSSLPPEIPDISDSEADTMEGKIKSIFMNLFNRKSKLFEEAQSSEFKGDQFVSQLLLDLREHFTKVGDFLKQFDLYNWDFDNYLEEDIPAAMEYIRTQVQPKDGKVLAIGHSMGGILLYAILSRDGFKGRGSGLAAVITLAASLDYTPSKSSLKSLLPLADPAEAFSVPVVPLGALMAAAHPFASRPPYVLSWLTSLVSAQNMMHPELFDKLLLNNFCTIPAKLLLQLTTAFRDGGLRNRSGTFFYKDHLYKCDVPVLALAGDQDLICPPEAVHETVKILPQHAVTYRVLGRPEGPHFGHYDLVGCRLATKEVYPYITEFLVRHDCSS